ncbi:MAG: RluA family pseudouridine synthase [Calditrichota bacterium]
MPSSSEISPEPPAHILREIEIAIPAGMTPERLDVFLARQVADLTRSRVQELIEQGGVQIDGKAVKASHKVRPGEVIRLAVLCRPPLELTPEPIPLTIVYEDEWLLVIDKPAGLVVHPAQGNRSGTLVNALLGHYLELEPTDDPHKPGIVHRLDKNTSGLLVVCKREPALSRLAKMFREHTIEREYQALVWWPMPTKRGSIDQPIGRDPRDRKKYAVSIQGKQARTHWVQEEVFDFLSLLAVRLETGRTHQIRVHLSNQGHPVFGDAEYAGRNRQLGRLTSAQRRQAAYFFENINRQMLHARVLGFKHPTTGQNLHFESPLPIDFRWILAQLRET